MSLVTSIPQQTIRALALAATAVVGLAGAGCERPEPGRMIHIPPPRRWDDDLARFRELKDGYFKTSTDSPLLSADRPGFQGLEYWEPDPALYFVGPIRAYADPQRVRMITTNGTERPAEKYGWIEFTIDGGVHALQVYRLLDQEPSEGPEAFFLAFYDETSGQETYPAGRYIELDGAPGGPYVLDFNMAFNPSCAYGDPGRFACPKAPGENRLPLRIEAGERGYGHAPAADAS